MSTASLIAPQTTTEHDRPQSKHEPVSTTAAAQPQDPTDRRRRVRPGSKDRRSRSRDGSRFQQRLTANQPVVRPRGNRTLAYKALKRTLDVVGATVLLVLLSPLLLTVLVTLTITTKGRPLFIQRRLGYLGRRFPMIKFRTMYVNADQMQAKVENQHQDGPIFKNRRDPRITPIGAWLRRTSIDEMPQLINVLLGHMSLVGPRPPVIKEVAQYEPWHRNRLAVKPGLTCLWQVSGRSEIGFEDWCRMDIWYLNNQNLATDLKLLIKTPWTVISGKGAY